MSHSCSDQEMSPRFWLCKVPGQLPLNINENTLSIQVCREVAVAKLPKRQQPLSSAVRWANSRGEALNDKH